MKILHIVTSMDPQLGGVSQGLRVIVTNLTRRGIDNEVASLDDPNAVYLVNDLFSIHALGPTKGSWQYASRLMPWLVGNLSRFNVVIIHGMWLYHSFAVRKAMQVLSKKVIMTEQPGYTRPLIYIFPHGMLDPYFQRASGRKFKALRNWMYWKLIESKVINEADGVLFTAEIERQLAHKPFTPYHPKREVVTGMGIESAPPYTSAMREAFLKICPKLQDQSYLLFLSRIHEKKGVDVLLKSYEKIIIEIKKLELSRETFDQIKISSTTKITWPRLVIAGPGLETSYGHKIRKIASESAHLRESVYFPGMLTGEAKWGALYECDAFVLPTHQENFGIAIVEALACSKPVLISNQTNIHFEIKHEGGGIVAADSVEGTYSLIKEWLSLSDEDRRVMSQRAWITYEKHFSINFVANRLVEAVSMY